MPDVACQTEHCEDVLNKLVIELGNQDDEIIKLKKQLKFLKLRSSHYSNDLNNVRDAIRKLMDDDIDFRGIIE